MLKLYAEITSENFKIKKSKSLFSDHFQALELLGKLKAKDGSFIALNTQYEVEVYFYKYNDFVFRIDIPIEKKQGFYQIFLSKNKTNKLVEEMYEGFNPLDINGLTFENNKQI